MNQVFIYMTWLICIIGICLYFYKSGVQKNALAMDNNAEKSLKNEDFNLPCFFEKYHWWFVGFIMLFAALVRLWNFPNIPAGLNQDEASIAYDSFAISHFGMDRNGDMFPVYPIAFGDGHGPLYTYLSMIAIKLLGLSVFSYRLTNVLLGVISTFVFYLLVKRVSGKNIGLLSLLLIAFCPTSIISSRWALDGNPLPFVFTIAVYLFVVASDSKKTWLFIITAGLFALTMYSYGPGGVVVPIFLLLSCFYMIYHRRLKWHQFFLGIGAFLVVITPLVIFMVINVFNLPPIKTPYISFSKFTVMRSSVIFLPVNSNYLINIIKNTVEYFKLVVFQRQDLIWNTVPGFGTTYLFTAPLIILGMFTLFFNIKNIKIYNKNTVMFNWFIGGTILCLLIHQNVNRIGIIYPSIVFLIATAIAFLHKQWKALSVTLIIFVAVSFSMFTYNYFNIYPQTFGNAFFYSFGDALNDAMSKTDGTIYVTEKNQNIPSIITLFYSKIPPQRFAQTVKYYNDKAEFRNAMYFDRFKFKTPKVKDSDAVYVIDNSEANEFDVSKFNIDRFKYYSVAYPKN